MTTFTSDDLEAALAKWREDILDEMIQLRALGIAIPDQAFEIARCALPGDYQEMDISDLVDLFIELGQLPKGAANE